MTLLELFSLLRKHLKLVIALPIACAVVCALVTLIVPNQYTAETTMYVLSQSDESQGGNTAYTDLNASQLLANDVASLAQSNRVMEDVASALGMESLDDFDIDIDSETTTRLITLSVTGADPAQVTEVANAFAQNISSTATDIMSVQAVNIVDQAHEPEDPSGPNRPLYILVALLAGLFIAVCIVVVADMVNTKARSDEDVTELLGVPVVGHFPSM